MSTEQQQGASTSGVKIYFRLLGYIKPYIGMFIISIIGFLIFASTSPMLGYVLKYFVDGLANPDAVLFPNIPWLADVRLLQAVPLLIVVIALWVGRFILARSVRSMTVLFDTLEQLDTASLQAQRKLTIPFLKEALG